MELLFRYTLVVVAVCLFVLVDWLSVKWFESANVLYAPVLVVVALAACWLFGWVGHMTSLSITSGLINTGIVMGTILVGILMRKDVLDIQQKIGLITAVVAVALITFHK